MKQNFLNSLQLQLQEHFFRSHPPYLKQLCDISAERLVFRSLVPGLFLVERENEPGYEAKCFVCDGDWCGVEGDTEGEECRIKLTCRIAASAVNHCEANILPQHISHGVRSLSEWLKEK